MHDLSAKSSVTGLCVGYELGQWRAAQFAEHLMEWLPEFALTYTEIEGIHSGNMVALMREAAKKVYATKKFENRGEFGELFLHVATRQVFGSLPAISKIYYKSARNETVKGFDAVHVVNGARGLELWLGEAKFYDDIGRAIRDVIEELKAHSQRDYLRDEFLLITGKIDQRWPHADSLKNLLSSNTSLDQVFKSVSIPVLLTYDSPCVAKHRECTEDFVKDFHDEIIRHYDAFKLKELPKTMTIHLFLLPLELKTNLIAELDRKLRGWQEL
ncbi:MAG: HamA C-terminal domain-containing protein [Acidiferrobacteraceae bacterium]